MHFEPTTLTATVQMLTETLSKHYQLDPEPLFDAAGLDISALTAAGARYPVRRMHRLWKSVVEATGDPCVGLVAGKHVRPTSFHALGFSWYASRTLLDSFHRLVRYHRLLSTTPMSVRMREDADGYALEVAPIDEDVRPPLPAIDAFTVAIIELCRQALHKDFRPALVRLMRHDDRHLNDYVHAFDAPVQFGCERYGLVFGKSDVTAPLPGRNADLARATDRVAEQYLDALEPGQITTQVRKLLVDLLPAGKAEQGNLARRLNRSTSTMQRQLRAEGINYRELLDETRESLAKDYLRDRRHGLSEIAFLLGFSDQSNFSRAFKRWTGTSPGEFRRE